MALSGLSNANFASGFTTGYGLVGTSLDRQMKREQLEQAQLNKERDYALKEQEADALSEYRASDLLIKGQNASLDAEIKRGNLGINKTKADTAKTQALTAEKKQDDLGDPNSLESKKILAEIASKNASTASSVAGTKKTNIETDRAQSDVDIYQSANNLSRIYDMLDGNRQPTSEELAEIESIYQDNKFTHFNVGTVVARETELGNRAIGQYLQDMESGMNPEMSNQVKKAFTVALGLNNSRALGREVTDEFVNAPEWMHNKGYRIESQGLYNATADSSGKLSGELYVWVKDDQGNQYPYPAPLTANRNNKDNKPLDLTLDDAIQSSAATAHMVSSVSPRIKPAVRQARIQAKYGNNRGDNGEEAFQKIVNNLLNTNVRAIQNGENTYNLFGMTGEMAQLPEGTILDEFQTAEMKSMIEEQLLFGARPENDQDRVDRWLETTSEQLKTLPFESGDTDNRKGASKPRTLSDIIPDEKFGFRTTSILQGYYDEKTGEIEDQEGLTRQLVRMGWITPDDNKRK